MLPSSWRNNPTLAHVLPFAACLVVTSITAAFKIKNPESAVLAQAPELIGLPVQLGLCLALLWVFRAHYPWRPVRGLGLAMILGTLGIALWLSPGWLYQQWNLANSPYQGLLKWFGFAPRLDGFDPTVVGQESALYPLLLSLRFLRLVLLVPLVEEIFWRSFLMRTVAHPDDDFQHAPFGRHTWRAFAVVTGLFMLIHAREDYLGALLYGSLTYWLCIRTKSLVACMVMHATANLLLGIYVMLTRHWGFW